jgi:hypothetical protein
MIHIIGDSHSRCFERESDKSIVAHWLGAATALNLWKKNKSIEEIIFQNGKESRYFLCFGEIDCRIHIYNKHMETGVPEYVLITNTLNSYIGYASYLKRIYNISIMAAPPQGTQENYFEYPHYATREHRQEITDYFNMWLEEFCRRDKLPFIDIWYNKPDFVRPLWRTQDFKEDKCHIKNDVAHKLLISYLEEHENR